MELKHMYAPQKDSPTTFLLGAINSTDTFVIVGNAQSKYSKSMHVRKAFAFGWFKRRGLRWNHSSK